MPFVRVKSTVRKHPIISHPSTHLWHHRAATIEDEKKRCNKKDNYHIFLLPTSRQSFSFLLNSICLFFVVVVACQCDYDDVVVVDDDDDAVDDDDAIVEKMGPT